MDDQIHQMEEGLDNLRERDFQPDGMGDLYNGMLKHTVSFEIQHMRKLREDVYKRQPWNCAWKRPPKLDVPP